MRFHTILQWILAAGLSFHSAAPALVQADSREELVKMQKDLAKKQRAVKVKESKLLWGGKWLVAGSNFARLFLSEKGPLNLLDWLGSTIPGFTPGIEHTLRKDEYITASKNFRDENLNDIELLVLVPHPKYASVVDMGLQSEFAAHEPPHLKIIASDKIELRAGFSAIVYTHDNGDCSLAIKAPRSCLIVIEVKSCSLKGSLIDLAQKLDLERLSMKLQS